MYQRARVLQAFAAEGLDGVSEPKLGEFLERVSRAEGDCWAELAQEVREKYPEYKERLGAAIWETGDPLIRLNLVRVIDKANDDERALLNKFVVLADPRHDAPVLRAAAAPAPPRPSISEAPAKRTKPAGQPSRMPKSRARKTAR
jgi:hypothetical protein